ncbi:hypothetical protein J4Q44_G00176350 [Coregonus suidteri]|uniref:Uncharacterized protein n=1 Tax=Coregonus suidteri TaxID=861788 RepID=A0AAN8M4E8_9TELE
MGDHEEPDAQSSGGPGGPGETPRYFVTADSPSRIHAMSQEVKLIVVCACDPVTRAISDYTQIVSKTPGVPSFETSDVP